MRGKNCRIFVFLFFVSDVLTLIYLFFVCTQYANKIILVFVSLVAFFSYLKQKNIARIGYEVYGFLSCNRALQITKIMIASVTKIVKILKILKRNSIYNCQINKNVKKEYNFCLDITSIQKVKKIVYCLPIPSRSFYVGPPGKLY